VATFHPGESRHQGDIRAEDGNGARGTTLDARIVQFSGYGLGYALMTSVAMSSMPMTFVLSSSVFSSRHELLVTSSRQLGGWGRCDFARVSLAIDGYPVNRLATGRGSCFHDLEGGLALLKPLHEIWVVVFWVVVFVMGRHGLLLDA
jgi:hypothetical protein